MRDNPLPEHDRPFALPGYRIVAIDGPQALAFSQAQFMNDVAALQPGHWHWNGWLTPKGRVVALFALLVAGPESIVLVLPDADAAGFVAQLQRFVFRSRITLALREDLHAAGRFGRCEGASGDRFSGDIADGVALDLGGDVGPRTLMLATTAATTDDAGVARWIAEDMRYGFPHLPEAQSQQWTPQHLSLDRLRAYSVKKGCYPGQEIVARTHFLGQAKRGLALFESDRPATDGMDVNDGQRAIGTVVCAVSYEGGTRLLAVLPVDLDAASTLSVDGVALRAQPLEGGLAR